MNSVLISCPECGHPDLCINADCPECGYPVTQRDAPIKPSAAWNRFMRSVGVCFWRIQILGKRLLHAPRLVIALLRFGALRFVVAHASRQKSSEGDRDLKSWQRQLDDARQELRSAWHPIFWVIPAACIVLFFVVSGALTSRPIHPPAEVPFGVPVAGPTTKSATAQQASNNSNSELHAFSVVAVSHSGSTTVGALIPAELSLSRSVDRTQPFELTVTETTPGGTGQELRNSLWQAAVVAALEAEDDLMGVRVNFKFSGQVDGPSAGGACCVALLAALRHQKMPSDYVFTGSVLPDGTVGRVGGILAKVKAAKAAGIRRILLPAYCRYEADADSGTLVDLKRLCESLGVTYVPVESVGEAYRQSLQLPASPEGSPQVVALVPPEEELLQVHIARLTREGDEALRTLPAELQSFLEAQREVPLATVRRQIDERLIAGNFWSAYRAALDWSGSISASSGLPKLANLIQKSAANTQAYENESKSILATIESPDQVLQRMQRSPQARWDILSLSRLQPGVNFELAVLDYHSQLRMQAIDATPAAEVPSGTTKASLKEQDQLTTRTQKLGQLLSHQHQFANTLLLQNELTKIRTFATDSNRSRNFRSLLVQAHQATYQTYRKAVLSPYATAFGGDEAIAHLDLAEHDGLVQEYLYLLADSNAWQTIADASPPQFEFTAAAKFEFATRSQIGPIACLWAIQTRWDELEPIVENQFITGYHRRELLNQLLARGKREAANQIAATQRAGHPATTAIAHYQQAVALEGQSTSDSVDVLSLYWRASLDAKLTRLTFKH